MAAKRKVQQPAAQLSAGYAQLLENLRQRIRQAQVRAALSVNRELVLLYWHIGREILQRQAQEDWGAKVIDRLAQDLTQEFPEMKGFSPRNLKYMRAFAEAWPDEQIVQQLVAQIPWGHNVRLLDYVKDPAERLWYVQQTTNTAGAETSRCTKLRASSTSVKAKPSRISSTRCPHRNQTWRALSSKTPMSWTFSRSDQQRKSASCSGRC